jgi:UDP-N-acetylglucosamine 2-epimerase (non-hydrolysing)
MEAGNRSFDANVPEELNRKMVDHVASFNLPYNDYSLRNLLAEGVHPRTICITGSPIKEILEHNRDKIAKSQVLQVLGLKKDGYFLVSVHRQENVDSPERLEKVVQCLASVRDNWGLPVLVSTHPRTKARLESLGRSEVDGVNFHEPFGYLDYNQLQINAKCVISDSGTISEESALLGFPAVYLRDSIERPESLDVGSMILTGLDPDNLVESVGLQLEASISEVLPRGYGSSDFSSRVVKFLFSTNNKHAQWNGIRETN